MTTNQNVSIDLCPINFDKFGQLNSMIKHLNTTLLFSKIQFCLQHSKLTKNGNVCITRTRQQMADWFGYTPDQIDGLLKRLEKKKLITKTLGTWWGKKQLFISSNASNIHVPINFDLLNRLRIYFDTIESVIVFSRIAFAFNNTTIIHEQKSWCALSKNYLARWSGIDRKKITSIIDALIRKGFILKKNFFCEFSARIQTHFHIPAPALKILKQKPLTLPYSVLDKNLDDNNRSATNDFKVIHSKFPKGKSRKPIRIRTKHFLENNITIEKQRGKREKCDIKLDKIKTKLNKRQKRYLISALERTYNRKNFYRSNLKTISAEVEYFILNAPQRVGVSTFKHAVNRAMKILSDKRWCTPFGFHKYDAKGKKLAEERKAREKSWEKIKQEECDRTDNRQGNPIRPMCQIFDNQPGINTNISVQRKAESILTQIKRYRDDEKNNLPVASTIAEYLMKRLYGLLKQGLDKQWLKSKLEYLMP